MSRLPTLAIAGATGNLGFQLTKSILLPELRARFKDVLILSRSSSDKAQELVNLGAKLRVYGGAKDSLTAALNGVDVLINTIGASGHAFKEQLLRAIPGTSIQIYFPSEFGVNHYIHDFEAEEWNHKKHHFQLTTELIPDVKVSRVFAGLFLEDSIGPWFGFHTKSGKYEAIGDTNTRVSYTAMRDVGKALAVLASLPADSIPDTVQLSGTNKSMREIAQIMTSQGAGPIEVTSLPLQNYKASVLQEKSTHLEKYLRFLMGEGKIDHSKDGMGNSDDFLNPGQTLWQWESMEKLALETQGKPWKDHE